MSLRRPSHITRHVLLFTDSSVVGGGGSGPVGPEVLVGTPIALYTAANLDLTYADTDPVTAWADTSLSTNEHNLTSSNPPTFVDSAINGKGIVRFASTGDEMVTPAHADFDFTGTGMTLIAMFDRTSGDFAGNIISNPGGALDAFWLTANSDGWIGFSIGPSIVTSLSDGPISNGFAFERTLNQRITLAFVVNAAFTNLKVYEGIQVDTEINVDSPLRFVAEATLDGGVPNATQIIRMGRNGVSTASDYPGDLSHISIYNEPLVGAALADAMFAPVRYYFDDAASYSPIISSGVSDPNLTYGLTYAGENVSVETDVAIALGYSIPFLGTTWDSVNEGVETDVAIALGYSIPFLETYNSYTSGVETDVVL